MQKVLFGIFAHPDDEAFGPSGTLIKMARDGIDIHLMCLTRGEAGVNLDGYEDLGAMRSHERQKAGEIIGVKSTQQFDFGDGQLCNNQYHKIAAAIEQRVSEKLSEYQEPAKVEFLTFEHGGLTGHLDHIAASMITSYVFLRLCQQPSKHRFTQVRYFCLPHSNFDNDVSFVYWPAGRSPEQIEEIVDISDVAGIKLAVTQAHRSQRSDANMWLEKFDKYLQQESFCFLKSPTDQES